MRPGTRTLLWAIGGLALALVLSWTAFAVAGGPISEPAGSIHVSQTGDPEPSQTPAPTRSNPSKTSTPPPSTSGAQPTPTDDHGGSSTSSSPVSDDSHGGDDD